MEIGRTEIEDCPTTLGPDSESGSSLVYLVVSCFFSPCVALRRRQGKTQNLSSKCAISQGKPVSHFIQKPIRISIQDQAR